MTINKKQIYEYNELIDCAKGKIFGVNNARLPAPNMLMFDKISHISQDGGKFDNGLIKAELIIQPDLWFFKCHFISDPVMPGCLGLDALWQLIGFYLGWCGYPGQGRALGMSSLKFSGEILPTSKLVKYVVNIRKIKVKPIAIALGDGTVSVDNKIVYKARGLKVGLKNRSIK